MTRRERLWATIKGERVDRPALSFHEIGGFVINPDDPDEYNIYNSPSWKPLLELAENETDIIRMVSPVRAQSHLAWDGSDHTGIRDQFDRVCLYDRCHPRQGVTAIIQAYVISL